MISEQQGVQYTELNPSYRMFRENSPIRYDENFRMWQVFRYQDIQKVLLDYGTWSSNQGDLAGELIAESLLSMDPPRHRQLHALASKAFSPRRVELLASRIEEITHSFLDKVIDQGHMDYVTDLAYPLPATVIAELLGIPADDRDRFKHWSDVIISEIGQPTNPRSNAQFELADYLSEQLDAKRGKAGNDLMHDFLEAEIDGEKLAHKDIVITSALLLMGGHETTTNLIANTLLCFYEHPGTFEELRANPTPELISSTVEEVLRYWSPLVCVFRVATKDTEINGTPIKAGEYVQLFLPSANRDAAIFPDPDRFDIRRTPNRHMAFGYSIHFCLGAPLARLEGNIVLKAILERFSSIEFPDPLFYPLGGTIIQGVKNLPINFTAVK